MDALARFEAPAWTAAAATAVSYGLVLGFLFALLFVLPFLVALALS